MTPFQPDTTAVGGSLFATAMVSCIPLLVVFVLLGFLKVKAHIAGLAGLASAILVAVLAFGMPVNLSLLAASQGVIYGIFPIMWIVVAAIWLYQLTVVSGRFEDLRTAFNRVSSDPRIQGIIIAFCFGGLLEALAGFGAPVAITGVMLVSLGFAPMRAAATVLLANTAPVAFGSIAIPIITAGNLTGIDYHEIGALVGRQAPLLASFVPLILVLIVDGKRGVKQTWPAAVVAGLSFAIAQFISSNYISVELTDIIASLVALVAVVVLLRFWQPKGSQEARERLFAAAKLESGTPDDGTESPVTGGAVRRHRNHGDRREIVRRPHPDGVPALHRRRGDVLAVQALVAVQELPGQHRQEDRLARIGRQHPVRHRHPVQRHPVHDHLALRRRHPVVHLRAHRDGRLPGRPRVAFKELIATIVKLRFAILTVASVLGLAYVMNLSGQTLTIGVWLAAGTGVVLRLPVPDPGLGRHRRHRIGHQRQRPVRHPAAAGRPAGRDRPRTAGRREHLRRCGRQDDQPAEPRHRRDSVGLLGRESEIFRKMIFWSLGLLLFLCILVYGQSTFLSWMV